MCQCREFIHFHFIFRSASGFIVCCFTIRLSPQASSNKKTRNITSAINVKRKRDSSENHVRQYRILSCCGPIINLFIAYLRKCNSVACKLLKIRGTAWTAYHQRQIARAGSQALSKMLNSHQVHHIFCYLSPDQP